jgi:rod shape-determining protein MreD
MADPVASARIGYRSLYLGLSALLIFLGLLPLSALPPDWPGPDLVLCLAIAWVLRRPDYAPALSLVAVFLISDLFAMRPPGLWALIVLIGTEFLRSREALTRDLPFGLEWAMVGAVIAAMALANWLVLALFMVPQIALGPVLMQFLSTLVAYPVVVALSHVFFGLRKVAPGEVDALGHRL